MSRELDERVVSMKFENQQFEQGVKQSERSVTAFNNTLNSMGSRGAALGSIANSVDAISSRFSALGIIGMTALQNIANKAVDAAAQLVKAFTIQPVSQGFQEYELKMGSVQTIMASTGASLQEVNGYLEELNRYADRTIYSFSDMTNNIGKFTNAGVSLDKAVLAIKGISNEAAVSGANAMQASHAMYNFAQALSAGYVKLIDWKSIENAQMATVEFKNELIDTAVKMGNLEKQADGTYKVLTKNGNGAAMKETISATKNFNDSLAYQWMTTDVLIETLGRYADETTTIGKKAYASAQDIKTFSMMMDTLKEATGSGWAQTFEIVFGNFEESKELWTSLGTVISDFITKQADARNKMLQSWKTLGGRDDILAGLKWTFRGFGHIVDALAESFENTFGRLRLYSLYKLSEGIKNLGLHFNVGILKNLGSIKDIFTGVFSGVHIFTQAISAAFEALVSGIKFLAPAGKGILEFVASIGRGITALDQFITKNQVFKKIFTDIGSIIKPVVTALQNGFVGILDGLQNLGSKGVNTISNFAASLSKLGNVGGKLSEIFSAIGDVIASGLDGLVMVFSKIGSAIGGFIKGVVGDLNIMDGIMTIVLTGSATKLITFIKSLKSTSDEAKSMFEVIKGVFKGFANVPNTLVDVLNTAKETIKAFILDLNASALIKIAVAIAVLAASLSALASLDVSELATGLAGVSVIMAELYAFMVGFTKLDPKKLKGIFGTTASLTALGLALIEIAAAMKILSTMSWEDIAKGLVGVTGALVGISAAMKLMPAGSKMLAIGPALVAVSAALIVLATALRAMGSMSMDSIGRSLIVLGGSLVELAVGLRAMNGTLSGSAALVVASAALLALAPALKILGTMDNDSIVHSLIALSGALMVLAVSAKAMEGSTASMAAVAVSLGILAGSLLILGPAMKLLSTLSWEGIAKGLIVIAAAFAELGIAGKLLGSVAPQMILISTALGVLGAALLIFTPALAALGSLSVETIVKGLVALAGTFAVLGAAAAILAPLTPVILALSVAIGVFGASVLAVGTGVALFGAGLTALAALTGPALESIANALKTVISVIPEFATAMANGFINVLQTIADNAPQVVKALITIFKELLTQLSQLIPQIAEIGLQLIVALLTAIREHIQKIVELGMEIVKGFLRGIAEHISEIVDAGLDIVQGLLRGIRENIQDIVTEAGLVVGEFIRGLGVAARDIITAGADFIINLGQGIRDNIGALGEFAGDIVGGFIDAASAYGDKLRTAGKDAIIKFITGLGDCAIEIANAATDVIVKFCEALGTNAELIMWAVSNLFDQIKTAFAQNFPLLADFLGIEAEEVSWEIPEGMKRGVYDREDLATGAVNDLGTDIQGEINSFGPNWGSSSENAGASIPDGTAEGVEGSIGSVTSAVESMGATVTDKVEASGSQYESAGETSGGKVPEGTASGINSKTGSVTTAVGNLVSTAKSAIESAGTTLRTAGESAGKQAGAGLAAGISAMRDRVVGAAQSIASAAASVMNSVLQINSPSKVTMKIGNGVGEGFAMGIESMIPSAEKVSVSMAKRTIDAAKKYLKINSPSKVAKDEVGNYIVEGVAEGIAANMSAEDAAKKKAENIINAFKAEIEKADFSTSIQKLNYDIWSALNTNVSYSEKDSRAIELAEQELAASKERLDLMNGQLAVMEAQFGVESQYYKDAQKEALQAEKDYADALNALKSIKLDAIDNQIKDIQANADINKATNDMWAAITPDTSDAEKSRRDMANTLSELESYEDRIRLLFNKMQTAKDEYGENSDTYKDIYTSLLKLVKEYADFRQSFADSAKQYVKTDKEIEQAIIKWNLAHQDTLSILYDRFHYTDEQVREFVMDNLGLNKTDVALTKAIENALNGSEKFIKDITEAFKSGNTQMIIEMDKANHYSELLVENVKEHGEQVVKASDQVATSTVEAVSDKSEDMKEAGSMMMWTLKDSIETEGEKAITAAKAVANAISNALASAKSVTTSATVQPVSVSAGTVATGANPAHRSTFTGASSAARAAVAAATSVLSSVKDMDKNVRVQDSPVNVTYNLTQNNQSPKSLSNADIYRKTNTLLSQTKLIASVPKGVAVSA